MKIQTPSKMMENDTIEINLIFFSPEFKMAAQLFTPRYAIIAPAIIHKINNMFSFSFHENIVQYIILNFKFIYNKRPRYDIWVFCLIFINCEEMIMSICRVSLLIYKRLKLQHLLSSNLQWKELVELAFRHLNKLIFR